MGINNKKILVKIFLYYFTINHLKMKYKITSDIKGTPIDLELINKEWKIVDFYVWLL